jgi:hypothetical protein
LIISMANPYNTIWRLSTWSTRHPTV